jgi:N-acetylglucosamine malate deacetylase 1
MNNDLILSGKKVLFIGAHPDDIEIGCGALIAHIVNQVELLCVTLSDNQKNPSLQNIVNEHYQSMAELGVSKKNIVVGQFITRNFPQERQEILEYLIKLNQSFHPSVVFTHTRADIHQDHTTTVDEALRAFRGTTVLGFDVLRSSYGFFPNFLIEVRKEDVDKKIAALSKYTTYSSKYYFDPEIARATMIRHGALAERPFAEGFDILRIIGSFGDQPARDI